jgi:hypothetical protein
MRKHPKIYLVHATEVAIPPIVGSFRTHWPEARIANLLDDALMSDLAADGRVTETMIGRFVDIGRYCVKAGGDAILFTCSAFGSAIDECRKVAGIPVLKPNEALYEQLTAKDVSVSLLATFRPSLPAMLEEIAACAKEKGTRVRVEPHLVDGALAALQSNRADEHNRLIADHAARQNGCDVIAFAQFSMAQAAALAATRTTKPILTTPDSAIRKLQTLLAW